MMWTPSPLLALITFPPSSFRVSRPALRSADGIARRFDMDAVALVSHFKVVTVHRPDHADLVAKNLVSFRVGENMHAM